MTNVITPKVNQSEACIVCFLYMHLIGHRPGLAGLGLPLSRFPRLLWRACLPVLWLRFGMCWKFVLLSQWRFPAKLPSRSLPLFVSCVWIESEFTSVFVNFSFSVCCHTRQFQVSAVCFRRFGCGKSKQCLYRRGSKPVSFVYRGFMRTRGSYCILLCRPGLLWSVSCAGIFIESEFTQI